MANLFNLFDFDSLGGNQLNKAISNQKLPTVAPYNPGVQPTYSPVKKPVYNGDVQISPTPQNNQPSGMFNYLKQKGAELYDYQQESIIDEYLNSGDKNVSVVQEMIKNNEPTDFIESTIRDNIGFQSQKDTIGGRIKSSIASRIQTGAESLGTEKTGVEKGLSLAKDAASLPFDIIGGIVTPLVEPIVKPLVEPIVKPVMESEPVQSLATQYGQFRQENPRLAQNIEATAGLGTAFLGAKYTPSIAGKAVQTGKESVQSAINIPKKIVGSIVPTPEEKLIKSVGAKTVEGVVQGKIVSIPVQNRGIMETLTSPIRTKDTKVLAGRALTPSYAGKTPKQIINTVAQTEKNVKDFYDNVRIGNFKGDINTLEGAAQTVISNMDTVGKKIGDSVGSAIGKSKLSNETKSQIKKVIESKIDELSGAYNPLKKFYSVTGKPLSIQDAFKVKKVFQAEISKLIKAGDAGTDAYEALVKGVQELSDNIDNAITAGKGAEFSKLKQQYALLKKLASDITKSAAVEGRRSPQTLVEQLGTLEALADGITNPLGTAKQLFTKEIAELNTRGGSWSELIKIYDKQAIKNKVITPKTIK